MSETFGQKLKKKRKQLKVSVPLLSSFLEVPATNFYKWEKGTRPLEYELNKKLEKFLKGEFDSLIQKKVITNKLGNKSTDSAETQENIFMESVENYQLRDSIIKSLNETIQTQKKLIENLEAQIRSLSEQGKAGARRAS